MDVRQLEPSLAGAGVWKLLSHSGKLSRAINTGPNIPLLHIDLTEVSSPRDMYGVTATQFTVASNVKLPVSTEKNKRTGVYSHCGTLYGHEKKDCKLAQQYR